MNGVPDLSTDREGLISYILRRLGVPVKSQSYRQKEATLRSLPEEQLFGLARDAHQRQVQLHERHQLRRQGRRSA